MDDDVRSPSTIDAGKGALIVLFPGNHDRYDRFWYRYPILDVSCRRFSR